LDLRKLLAAGLAPEVSFLLLLRIDTDPLTNGVQALLLSIVPFCGTLLQR
jgi:hypothetical protein